MLVTNGGSETLSNSKQSLSKVQIKHNSRDVYMENLNSLKYPMFED